MRIQLVICTAVAIIAPVFVRFALGMQNLEGLMTVRDTAFASFLAVALAIFLVRKVSAFPGTSSLGFVIPSFLFAFGVVMFGLVFTRLEYSRSIMFSSLVIGIICYFVLAIEVMRGRRLRFYLVPAAGGSTMLELAGVTWIVMDHPHLPGEPDTPIVADIHYDHTAEWENMLALAAISGRAVYHYKQVRESISGRVQIQHLSENSFGSLLPNLAYYKIKRAADLTACILLLPVLIIPGILLGIAIKWETPGPALFRQERIGLGGRPFRVFKFRSMRVTSTVATDDPDAARASAITHDNDTRVTRLGRFLRQTRIDEMPQILNVLKGEMSWIGPRPEAVPLSRWYETELPFYIYRHIVRPGITGWAQVNQGHVADLLDVDMKLQYDFFYVKNFSAWLDILIVFRTVRIMLSGFGAR